VHPAIADLQVELDAVGNLVSATVAVEKLQALNPSESQGQGSARTP
jgi:hypothetical protein